MIGTALTALLIMAILSLLQERRLITESRKDMLTTAVQSAHNIVVGYQAKAASGAMSVEDAQKAAKDALRIARYGGPEGKTEYFYIWTTDGVGVMHPFKTEWDGQDMLGKVKDGSGVDIIGLQVNGMRNSKDGKAFVPTMFTRPGQQTPVPKLQYIVKVDGWNWIVGSGLYTDNVDVMLRQALWSSLALVLAVFAAVGVIGLLVSRSVLRQIGGEPTHAIAIMSEVAGGNLDAQIPAAPRGSMLDGLAHMVTSLRKLVTKVRSATDSIATASSEIAQGNNDLPTHRRHGQQPADHSQQHGGADQHGEADLRLCPDRQPDGHVSRRSGGTRGRGGVAGGVHHAGHQRQQQEDQRHHRCHRRHRVPDQHPGAQCRRGSRPCRRTGSGFCRGGGRGAQPGAAPRLPRRSSR